MVYKLHIVLWLNDVSLHSLSPNKKTMFVYPSRKHPDKSVMLYAFLVMYDIGERQLALEWNVEWFQLKHSKYR